MVQLQNLCSLIGVPWGLIAACVFLQYYDKAAAPSGGALATRPELQVQFLPALTLVIPHTQVLLAPVSALNQHCLTKVLQVKLAPIHSWPHASAHYHATLCHTYTIWCRWPHDSDLKTKSNTILQEPLPC
jgi:hypothetical protein